MSDFKTKMLQIQLRLWFCTRPIWESLSAPQATSQIKGKEVLGREDNGEDVRGRKGGDGRGMGLIDWAWFNVSTNTA